MQMIRNACVLACVAIATALCGSAGDAQTVMTDRESSARAAQLQQAAEWRLVFRPALQVLRQTVSQLRTLPRVSDSQRDAADEFLKQSSQQAEPDARRTLWRAASTLLGKPWNEQEALLGSLALRSATPVSTGQDDRVRFELLYPAEGTAKLSYSLELYKSEPTSSATPVRGPLVRQLMSGELSTHAATEIRIDLSEVADGPYLLISRVSTDAETSTELAQPFSLVRDLAGRYAALKADLAAAPGRETTKWVAQYPFALAEALRADKREIIAYDFPKAITRSNTIITALKSGRDEVWQAKGIQARAYRFEETGELIPYQVYVPSTWTPDRKWPLVVALHESNLDETNMLGRNNGAMQKIAEQHGFIVVSPLGYRLNSAYGSERGSIRDLVAGDMERLRRSEQDVLQVMALVEKEYNVDPSRRYLTGNSMGGGGTWWIGGRYPDRWAALAPGAYGNVKAEDVPGLSKTPILAVVGEKDELGMRDRVREFVAILEAGGVKLQYLEVPGGTHTAAFDSVLPQVFEFFARHSK